MSGPQLSPPLLGRILGTEDAMPTVFWFLVEGGQSVQLDDLVVARTRKPGGQEVSFYGLIDSVRKRHEGVTFESDVVDVASGVLPAIVSYTARVLVTRVDPEQFVPPQPGDSVYHARGHDLTLALSADKMKGADFPGGLLSDGQTLPINYNFVNGKSGGHINISGISGVATKTSYALFLLHSIFTSGVMGLDAADTRAVIFNVKGEDLLYLNRPNKEVKEREAAAQAAKGYPRDRYALMNLPQQAFQDVQFLAPPRANVAGIMPDVERATGITPYLFTVREFCARRMLPFAFSDRNASLNLGFVIGSIEDKLERLSRNVDTPYITVKDWKPDAEAQEALNEDIQFEDLDSVRIDTLSKLIAYVEFKLLEENDGSGDAKWTGRNPSTATLQAFVRRLRGVQKHLGPLIRGDISKQQAERYQPNLTNPAYRLSVVDIHRLTGAAQMFVVGVLLRDLFEYRERTAGKGVIFVVLDELNKYAPRDGDSPIKDVLLDIAERGRSLGIILIGAQQTASEVERRIVSNAAIRVVGRLDMAEAERPEYRFLPQSFRARAGILQPGTMLVSQPDVPNPVLVNYPFPAWATRFEEVQDEVSEASIQDLFGL